MKHRFVVCGLLGWCMEILWTGLNATLRGESTMTGKTSLLMFPIYGCAALIAPVYKKISAVPAFFRGCLYACCIFITEFASGSLLKHFRICPWDYSHARLNYKGLIRLDFAPLWFAAGLFFEKVTVLENSKIPS